MAADEEVQLVAKESEAEMGAAERTGEMDEEGEGGKEGGEQERSGVRAGMGEGVSSKDAASWAAVYVILRGRDGGGSGDSWWVCVYGKGDYSPSDPIHIRLAFGLATRGEPHRKYLDTRSYLGYIFSVAR